MDEEKGLSTHPTNTHNNGLQSPRPEDGLTRGFSLTSLRNLRLSSPGGATSPIAGFDGTRSPRHDSKRPPLLRPTSIIPPLAPNVDFKGDNVVPWEDKLANYRRLVGIDSAPSHTQAAYHRPGENLGIYHHVVRGEVTCLAKYRRFSLLINSCLGIQIIVAAALTALGAGGM